MLISISKNIFDVELDLMDIVVIHTLVVEMAEM